jgi:TrmH family RNA methyltransferase
MISKSQISYIKSLHLKKFRKEYRQFIVEGEKLCDEFIHANFSIRQIYLLDSKRVKYEVLLSKISKKIEILPLKQDELVKISAMTTAPDVIMLVDMPEEKDAKELLMLEKEELILMLDGIKDPGNLGTIVRIADWFGIKKLICSDDCVELYNPKVVQATMGSLLRVQVAYGNLPELIASKSGLNIYGALLNGDNVYSMEQKMQGVLLMGSESHGISEALMPYISHPISIPSFGGAESLNVAIATAILCSEAKRRDI